jgi:hypothetical protein
VERLAVLVGAGAPAGLDGGNWLAFGRDLLGPDVRSPSIVYPPLVPLATTAAVAAFGPVWGTGLVAALASLAPGVATWLVLRAANVGWPAVLLAGLVVVASTSGEPAAWGGYPQLLGGGLGLLFLAALDRALRDGSRSRSLLAGLLLAATLATSHLAAAVAGMAAAALVLGHLLWVRPRPAPAPAPALLAVMAWVALPALPLVPLYVRLVAAVTASLTGVDRTDTLRLGDLPDDLGVLFPDVPAVWIALLLAGLVVVLLLVDRRHTPLWLVATASMVGTLVPAALAGERRFLYLLPPAAALAVGLWVWDLGQLPDAFARRARTAAVAALAGALAVQAVAGVSEFRHQRDFYGVVTPGLLEALDWLRRETPPGSVVAVSPVRDWPLGWWVEGLGRRPTLPASSLQWFYFEDERRRARLANEIFGLSFPSAEGLATARRHGADYALVATAWLGYSEAALAAVRSTDPGVVAFANPSAVVLRTAEQPPQG